MIDTTVENGSGNVSGMQFQNTTFVEKMQQFFSELSVLFLQTLTGGPDGSVSSVRGLCSAGKETRSFPAQ